MKVLWLDTETTGLDPIKHDIIQIAGIVEIDGEFRRKFEFKCRPHNPANIDPETIKIHGYTVEEMNSWQSPLDLYRDLISLLGGYVDKFNKLDKFIPAGQNVKFDIEMLHSFFIKCKDRYLGSWIRRQNLDLIQIAVIANYLGFINPKNYKLETLAQMFGIKFDAHDAMADIIATREVGEKLLSLLKPEKVKE